MFIIPERNNSLKESILLKNCPFFAYMIKAMHLTLHTIIVLNWSELTQNSVLFAMAEVVYLQRIAFDLVTSNKSRYYVLVIDRTILQIFPYVFQL